MNALKRYAVPLVALVYILGFAAKLHEYADTLGWRVLSIASFALATAWTAYVWSAKELTIVQPQMLRPRYGLSLRAMAILLAAVTLIPVWFSLQPVPEFRVPALEVHLANQTTADVALAAHGEFYLTAPKTPAMDVQVASGRLRLRRVTSDPSGSHALVVPAGGELSLVAEVLNPRRFERLLASRELSMRIVIFQANGPMLTKGGILFDSEVLSTSYVEMVIRSEGG